MAPPATTSGSASAAQPATTSGPASAAQPATTSSPASAAQPVAAMVHLQSLKMLMTKQSAKIGQFKVIVSEPWIDAYTYQWEGKQRETTAWRCMLVSAADPTLYCLAEFKLTARNKALYEKNEKTNKEGTTPIISNVALVEGAKAQYMSCSVRASVNMATTKLVGVFAPLSAVQPVPKTTVAQRKEVRQKQNFDLTAFVLSRHPVRNGGDGRKAFDLELADGSADRMSGKVQTIEVSVFASDADVAAQAEFAEKNKDPKDPVSFFNLRGSKVADQNAYTFFLLAKASQ